VNASRLATEPADSGGRPGGQDAGPASGVRPSAVSAPEPGAAGSDGAGSDGTGPGASGSWASGTTSTATFWRQWRVPLMLIAVILLGAIVIALLVPAPKTTNSYLDPAGTGPVGAHALTDILVERGHQVISSYSTSAALAAAGSGGATIVVTSPQLLTGPQLTRLSLAPADIVLVQPDQAALTVLSPGVTIAASLPVSGPVPPDCRLAAAQLAGAADVGGLTFAASPTPVGAVGCYPVNGSPSLLRYSAAGKIVTIIGSGMPLTNGFLADQGNAALALNLLTTSHRIVWLTPEPPLGFSQGQAGRPRSNPPLIPVAAYLVALQLGIAVLLAALWRARRLGPLVPERLPVVVRASETVEGHARLYQSRRARNRAAAVLREGMLSRVGPALGLARSAPQDAVTEALAGRSRLSQQEIAMIIFGPPPAGDAELVALVRNLDELEREVRSQ